MRWDKALEAFRRFRGANSRCAAVAFYSFLAIFPALAFLATIIGILGEAPQLRRLVIGLRFIAPDGALDVLSDRLTDVFARSTERTALGLVVSAAIALWLGIRAIGSLFLALNDIHPGTATRTPLQRLTISVVFSCLGGASVFAGLVAITSMPALAGASGFPRDLVWMRWPVLLFCTFAILCAVYRFGPDQHPLRLVEVLPGAAVASLLWATASILYATYTERLGGTQTFGPATSAGVLLVWLYVSARACTAGAAINVWLGRQSS